MPNIHDYASFNNMKYLLGYSWSFKTKPFTTFLFSLVYTKTRSNATPRWMNRQKTSETKTEMHTDESAATVLPSIHAVTTLWFPADTVAVCNRIIVSR